MSELPRLVPANCAPGHLVPEDLEPNALIHGQPARVCSSCLEAARAQPRRVETKMVRLGDGGPVGGPVLTTYGDAGPEVVVPTTAPPPQYEVDWTEEGRRAARANAPRTLPAALAGLHPRSAKPRAWFAGWDEVKPNG